jgi:hypothetical protein
MGCSNPNNGLITKEDPFNKDYSVLESEILAWTDSLGTVCERLDLEVLNDFHLYNEKFTRIEYMPEIGGIRMDEVEGKKREDDYFGFIDKFEQKFSDLNIDVLDERNAILTMKYEALGYKEGEPIHDHMNTWLTLFIVKPEKEWKIIYESMVAVQ